MTVLSFFFFPWPWRVAFHTTVTSRTATTEHLHVQSPIRVAKSHEAMQQAEMEVDFSVLKQLREQE